MKTTALILALLALTGASRLGAQSRAPGPGPTLLEPLDWSATGAWKRRAAPVRALRRQLLQAGNLAVLNGSRGPFFGPSVVMQNVLGTAVTGAFHVPVMVIAYKDIGVPFPLTQYQCLLFSRAPAGCGLAGGPEGHPYTVTTYYEELSHHRITMDGVVFPSVTVDSAAAFYTDGCKAITVPGQTSCPNRNPSRIAILMNAALDSISNRPGGDTIWAQFDNDGPDGQPNSGDDDGNVDFVIFLQPEVGGECTSNVPLTTGVWSHRFTISGWLGHSYTTKTPRRNAPGQFLKVNDYTIQSELGGSTSCLLNEIMGVGTVAHETGHAFGLPDLYDTRASTQGIGGWGLMGSGNYARPYSPSSYDAWSLNELGWATIDSLGSSRIVTASPRLLSDTVFYARMANPDEFMLIENRAAVLSDTAQMNQTLNFPCPTFGFCLKSPGLLLWNIDNLKVQAGLPGNAVNSGSPHGVALIQADGLNQLRTSGSRNRGDKGDPYPGSSGNTKISLLSFPAARDNIGGYFGFIIDQIQELGGGPMRFRFTRREPSVVQAQNGAQVRVNGQALDRFEEVVPAGDQIQVSVDAVQILAAGKTRATFLAWSNGGPRDQTLTSAPAKPDTLTATFSLEHRLLVPAPTGGTVTSTVQGNLPAGIFLAQNTPVTLTATPAVGFVLAGWRGDTVATAPALNLVMRKGYDLEARFVAEVPVVGADAVAELLGTPKLTDAQRTFLDELGNRNAILDVGDILAMYRRSGQAVPPALRQAITRRQTGTKVPQ